MPNVQKAFVATIIKEAKKQALSHSELARRVWKDHGDPVRRWRAIRNGTARLTLTKAWELAQVVGVGWEALQSKVTPGA